jgi:uncharacterized membrane protein YdjX (TVP38/TMEM64 family)
MKRQWIVLIILLLLPAIALPFLGDRIDQFVNELQSAAWKENTLLVSLVIVLVLASDLLLPIPSSVVNTWAGGALGVWMGAFVCWIGMNLGAWIGYVVSWYFGNAAVNRFTSEDEIEQTRNVVKRSGAWALVLLRPVPVLAEASVLVVGSYRISPLRFWIAVGSTNLVIAVLYALLGYYSQENEWFVLAMYLAIVVPVLVLAFCRSRLFGKAVRRV